MLLWVTIAVAAVVWVGLIFFFSRYLRRGRFVGQEEGLNFELQAAPWSDSHVAELLRKVPRSPILLNQYVANAIARQDWAEAERRLALFRQRAPRQAGPWLAEAELLRRRGQPEAARAVIERALRRLPREENVLLAAARESRWAHQHAEAAQRFARLRAIAGRRAEGYSEGAEVLAETGEWEAAMALIAEGRRRFPDYWVLVATAARIAERHGDRGEALRCWQELRERFPGEESGYLDGAAALERAGEVEAARGVLELGCDYLPGNQRLREALARLAPPPPEAPPAAGS